MSKYNVHKYIFFFTTSLQVVELCSCEVALSIMSNCMRYLTSITSIRIYNREITKPLFARKVSMNYTVL